MRVHHHPDCATLMAYASGTLCEALSMVVACHVAWCPHCQRELRRHEETGGAIIERMDAVPVKADCLTAVLQRIDAECREARAKQSVPHVSNDAHRLGLPKPLCRLLGRSLDQVAWRRIAPGIAVHRIALAQGARGRLLLMKISGGRALPRHGHSAGELTMVLRGAYRDEFGRFAMGDIADLGHEVEHKPITEQAGDCVCLVGIERPWRLKGLMRLVQPLLRL
ncbi:ChrR family anti-sigma-E factor [Rhodoligotrophos defluvii]|uniref:ChrR family anti-sigma-E factor n=1 Tax=Rhodoligotrophos defluvii TaxID=2561934 RepID=UPI0010C98F3E|nr:ChrR family anti-sigma-E factor [Rhodoligotrophos defluvii]